MAPISIFVSAFLPLILAPVLGLLGGSQIASAYWNDAIVLFLGSFALGRAFEEVNLHRRIALKVLIICGARPRLLLLGFLLISGLLSMWMSNTGVAALLLPLVMPVIQSIERNRGGDEESSAGEDVDLTTDLEIRKVLTADNCSNYSKSLLIGIGFSANLGGIGTLVGTGPNVALVAILGEMDYSLSFLKWMAYAVPISILGILTLWLLLLFQNRKTISRVRISLDEHRREYEEMGVTSFEQIIVMVVFLLLASLWLTRSLWSGPLFGGLVKDGTCSMVVIALFIIPARNYAGPILPVEAIKTLHWDVTLLLGSGFALARVISASGLSEFMAQSLQALELVPISLLVFLLVLFAAIATQFTSNVATANILLPICASLAIAVNQNPLLLMLPVCCACSCAFLLPIATPPITIVYSSGLLRSRDLLQIGSVMNIFCVAVIALWTLLVAPLWGIEFGIIPTWASVNVTSV